MIIGKAFQPLEVTTTLFGILSVYLSVSRRWWTWPTGMVNVVLSAWLFVRTGLYSDAGLQVIYFALCIYGWAKWGRGSGPAATVNVTTASARDRFGLIALGVVLWMCLSGIAVRVPGSALPYLDAALTAGSVIAELMMARKLVETWISWIILDTIYVGMFAYKGLFALGLNYFIYLILADMGRREWNVELLRSARLAEATNA